MPNSINSNPASNSNTHILTGGISIGQSVSVSSTPTPRFNSAIDYIIAEMFHRGWHLTNAVAQDHVLYTNAFTLTFSNYIIYQKTEIRQIPQIPVIDSSSITVWNTVCDMAIQNAGPIT